MPPGSGPTGRQCPCEALHPGVEQQRLRQGFGHPAVPAGEQRLRGTGRSIGHRQCGQAGQGIAGEQADIIHLHRSEAFDRVLGRGRQQRAGAPGAQIVVPVAAEEHREILRRHALVGIHQPPAGWRHDVRQGAAAGPADPVMSAIGPRHRCRAVAGAAHRHAPGEEQRDAPPVGHDHVLHGRADEGRGPAGGGDIRRPVQRQQPGSRGVGRSQIGHCRGQDRTVGRNQIADDRAMPGFAHVQHLVGLAAHRNALFAQRERARPLGGHVVALAGRGLDEQVLHIRPGGGEAPGDAIVMSQHHHRHARCRRPGQHALRRLDARQVPGAGQGEAEMRIAGQQRRASGRMPTIDRPGIAGAGRQGERVGEARQQCCEFCREIRHGGVQRCVRRGGGCGTGPYTMRTRPGTLQLGAPVARQIQSHGFGPQQRVGRSPGPRRAQHDEFGRREPAARPHPGVHAAGIGLQHGACVGIQRHRHRRGTAPHAEHPHHPVERQGGGPGNFGNLAGCGAAHQVHLEQPLTGMQVAERGRRVAHRGGANARDRVGVDLDCHRCRQAGDGGTVVAAGQAVPDQPGHRAGEHQHQHGQAGNQAQGPTQQSRHDPHLGRKPRRGRVTRPDSGAAARCWHRPAVPESGAARRGRGPG